MPETSLEKQDLAALSTANAAPFGASAPVRLSQAAVEIGSSDNAGCGLSP